jgi:hypothetical protein
MHARVAISCVLVASVASVASAFACVDLFHSTSDVPSLCDLDAQAPGCVDAEASDSAPPPTLCAADAGVAATEAERACAWLAACEHPIGQNLTGACMANAILAYDCEANPNRKPKGKAETFWSCMQNATNCGSIAKCVFPDGVPAGCLSAGFLGCSQSAQNPASRIDCPITTDAGTPGENCAAVGQTCDSLDPDASNSKALCVGAQRRACTGNGCDGTFLSLCDDAGIDRGYDCTSVGAAACDLGGTACVPENGTTGVPHSNDVTCSPGNVVATGSPAAIKETVDCTALSGAGSCVPIEGGAPGTIPADACHASACVTDACSGSHLSACVRGRIVDVDCIELGLQACDMIATEEGNVPSCLPP